MFGVMKILESNESEYFRVMCDCTDQRCDATLGLEWDEEFGVIELFVYKTMYWKEYYRHYPWYQRIWKRVSAATKLLFGGYLEMQGDMVFCRQNHVESIINALHEAKEKIEAKNKKEQGLVT